MALIALEFLAAITMIVVILFAISGAVVTIQYAWNIFKSALNIKE